MMNKSTKASPLSRAGIRKVTNSLKEQFNIPTDKPFPIVKFMEYVLTRLGLEYEIIPNEEMGGVYAETTPENGKIFISESTYDGACDGIPRDKFTIAHEIGHGLLHTLDRVIFTRTSNEIKPYESPEWQANVFAGELLVHTDSIHSLSVEDIADKYEVSFTVASIQKEKSN